MFRSLRIRFPGSEKLGPSRSGRIERNFPVIPIFRNFRPTSRFRNEIPENDWSFAPQPGIFGRGKRTWSPKNAEHSDCRPCWLTTFFLIFVFASTFHSHIFGIGHKLVLIYISECLLRTGRASSVCDRWRIIDSARETILNVTGNLMPHVTCAFSTLALSKQEGVRTL